MSNTNDILVFDTEKAELPQVVKTFDLVTETDPILKEVMPEFDFKNPPVNPVEFASSLVDTCMKYKGYGLSANQCGFKYRVFVMGGGEEYVAMFNPKIIATSPESVHMKEGCLSFPMLGLSITRPAGVVVEYQDYNGELKTTNLVGMSARCFFHELDHMNGIVYTSKVKPLALQMGMKKRTKIKQMMAKAEKSLDKLSKLKMKEMAN
jgi:peptide deformylase